MTWIQRGAVLLCPVLGLFVSCARRAASSPRATGADTLGWMQSTYATEAGKTAIFCLSGDEQTKRRMETYIAADMKRQGFEVYEGHALVPPADDYSADGLAAFLHKNGFQSVADVMFKGDVQVGRPPDNFQFSLHKLPKPRSVNYSSAHTTFDLALRALLSALVEAGTIPAR